MELTLRRDQSSHPFIVIVAEGDLDVYTVPQLRELLVKIAEESRPQVVIDMQGVAFLDSTGLGVLVGGQKRLRAEGGELWLVGVKPGIRRVFEITGLATVFNIVDSIEAVTDTSPAAR